MQDTDDFDEDLNAIDIAVSKKYGKEHSNLNGGAKDDSIGDLKEGEPSSIQFSDSSDIIKIKDSPIHAPGKMKKKSSPHIIPEQNIFAVPSKKEQSIIPLKPAASGRLDSESSFVRSQSLRKRGTPETQCGDRLGGLQYCVKLFAIIYLLHILFIFSVSIASVYEIIEDDEVVGGNAQAILIFVLGTLIFGILPLNVIAASREGLRRWLMGVCCAMPVAWYWDRQLLENSDQELNDYEWGFWYGCTLCYIIGGAYIFAGLSYLAMGVAFIYAFMILMFILFLLIYGCCRRYFCSEPESDPDYNFVE